MYFPKSESTDWNEQSEPIFCSTSYTFQSAEAAAENFAKDVADGYIYSRFSNPTTQAYAKRVAELEGAELALPTGSGMSAILSTIMGLCQSGDTVLCSANAFGATVQLLTKQLSKFNINTVFVYSGDTEEWITALDAHPNTRMMLLETPSNPLHVVVDIAALAAAAKERDVLFVVDNCFCPYLQKPLEWGADIVVGSATKYIDGQGRILGGLIAGGDALLKEKIYPFLRSAGPALSPFNAWVLLKSLETLPIRMQQHSQSALHIAQWLETSPQVERVIYTGLPSHPNHTLAMQQQSQMGGGIVSFQIRGGIRGGQAAAWTFINNLKLFSITANFGDTRSIVTHPATTTHLRVAPDVREKIGLNDAIIRLSIGLEPVELLQNDINQALLATAKK